MWSLTFSVIASFGKGDKQEEINKERHFLIKLRSIDQIEWKW